MPEQMISENIITSAHNPHIKNAVKLREKKWRDSRKLMIIDGYRAINMALNNRVALKELFYCERFFKTSNEKALVDKTKQKGAGVFQVGEKVFSQMAYGDNPEGIIGITSQPKMKLADLPLGGSALYLILESLEKPGNLGALLRTSDAAGVDGVIVCDSKTDIYNPNVIRSSMGAVFTVPVVQADGHAVLEWLKKNRIKVIAATPSARTEYTRIDYKDACAIVLGSENKGISLVWADGADSKIKIPMCGQADSLNVSVAAAIILYEALRQQL